jgi:hypothetical protein
MEEQEKKVHSNSASKYNVMDATFNRESSSSLFSNYQVILFFYL